MSSEDDTRLSETADAPMQEPPTPTEPPSGPAAGNKKRPRLDLNVDPRERKRGKSMFGIVLGTLNRAKIEDKERNASDAAKKRQLIEQRLQNKLRKETDSVRRAEEAKKDKTQANRKEEDLQLKDSIHKLRRTRLPLLSNFLLTSDNIPTDNSTPPPPTQPPQPSKDTLSSTPRAHPPPLYYLPTILTPAQETFLARRKADVKEEAEQEWLKFREERAAGIQEIRLLRQRVAEEEARKKAERGADVKNPEGADNEMPIDELPKISDETPSKDKLSDGRDVEMDTVDDGAEAKGTKESKDVVESESKEEPMATVAAVENDDDALEY